jgi:hypothetical protein
VCLFLRVESTRRFLLCTLSESGVCICEELSFQLILMFFSFLIVDSGQQAPLKNIRNVFAAPN